MSNEDGKNGREPGIRQIPSQSINYPHDTKIQTLQILQFVFTLVICYNLKKRKGTFMVQIPMKTSGPSNRHTILSINQKRVQRPMAKQTILEFNKTRHYSETASQSHTQTTVQPGPVTRETIPQKSIPQLIHPMQKGQKLSLESKGPLLKIKACLGWNVTNNSCDVDVSAFLLNANGKAPGDSWFVFYGQEQSPDNSTVFSIDSGADREMISVDLQKLDTQVQKIVFVLTIHEAF